MGTLPDIEIVRRAWDAAVGEVDRKFRSSRFTTTGWAYAKLRAKYRHVAQTAGGNPYGLEHVAFCLEALDAYLGGLTEEHRKILPILAFRLALLYAWSKRSRPASAEWAKKQLLLWAGPDSRDLQNNVYELILTVRAWRAAQSLDEQIIAQIGLLGDEREHEKR